MTPRTMVLDSLRRYGYCVSQTDFEVVSSILIKVSAVCPTFSCSMELKE